MLNLIKKIVLIGRSIRRTWTLIHEEDMEDVKLYDKRERHWRIDFEENDGGVDDKKLILHDNR